MRLSALAFTALTLSALAAASSAQTSPSKPVVSHSQLGQPTPALPPPKPLHAPKPHHSAKPAKSTAATHKTARTIRHPHPTTHPAVKPKQAAAPVPLPPPPTPPLPPPAPPKGTDSGLPLPRFAALRSDQVSLRAGPGTRYPIQWVYQRRYLPVKIEREFEVWRLISEPDGTSGWVHEAMLTGRRGFLIVGDQSRTLRATPDVAGQTIAILKPGVVGRLKSCPLGKDWCQVEVKGYAGWLNRSDFWGAAEGEAIVP